MERLIHFLEILLPLAYLVCAFIYGVGFVTPAHPVARWGRRILEHTLILHLAYLLGVSAVFDRLPLASVFEVLSFLAFALAVVYLYLERRLAEKSVGLFVLALVFAFQLISSGFVIHPVDTDPLLHGGAMAFHITSAMLGYAAFTISAVFSLMYLMLYHEIRQHRFGLIYSRMPSLDVMASFCIHGAQVGFFFLSLAVLAGAFRAHFELPDDWYRDPKVVSVGVIWLIYGAIVALAFLARWRGRRVAVFSLAGYGVALLSLLLVNFLSDFHGFR